MGECVRKRIVGIVILTIPIKIAVTIAIFALSFTFSPYDKFSMILLYHEHLNLDNV